MIDELGSRIADCGIAKVAYRPARHSAIRNPTSQFLSIGGPTPRRSPAVKWFAFFLLLTLPAFAGNVPELIDQLGDPRYAERRDAQRQLIEVGLRAYDALDEATKHSDPEIAAASRRLLGELTHRWDWASDPTIVRQRLEGFGEQPEAERLDRVRSFARLRDERGAPALCRIVRYDLSPRVSREAARVLLNVEGATLPLEHHKAIAKAMARLDKIFGPSRRAAAGWLALAADPTSGANSWREAVRQEAKVVRLNNGLSDQVVLNTLLWQWLRVAIAQQETEATVAAAGQLADASAEFAELRLGRALQWMAEARQWKAVEAVLAQQENHLQSKRGLYLRARLFSQQGQLKKANKLAEQAFASSGTQEGLPENDDTLNFGPRVPIAHELHKAGFNEWAEREYAEAGRQLDPLTISAAYARWQLSDLLQDTERYEEAAAELAMLDEAINATKETLKAYRKLANQGRPYLQAPSTIAAREAFYRALAHRQRGEPSEEIAALREAINHEPGDADIVIAMYRAEGADAKFAADTRKRIAALCQGFEEAIAGRPMNPTPFNQWAWLVSNTTGDFSKAVRYSERSLELSPDEAGFLDTLGRCYYAVGDYEAALKAQRRAVEQQPNMQVMQRQLARIEAALHEGSPTEN